MLTLEETIQLILKNSPKLDRKDVMEMIEEKRQELGPEVVNEESAAMIVARELGIDLQQITEKARMKIEDITENTRNIMITAKVVSVDSVRTFSKSGGGEGKVASMTLADETGRIRGVLWDDMTRAISEEAIAPGTVVQIRNAYVKKGLRDALELNLGRMGGLRVLDEYELDELEIDVEDVDCVKIKDLTDGMYDISIIVEVKRAYGVNTFTRKDGTEGKVFSIIGADETASTRVTFWDDHAEEMEDTKEGEVIQLNGAYTKEGRYNDVEVHSSRSSTIKRRLKERIEAVDVVQSSKSIEPFGKKSIAELTVDMQDVDIEGKVIRIFKPNEFERDDGKGRVQNILIADDSGTVRVTFWNEDVDKIEDLKEEDIVRISHGYVKEGYRGGVEYHFGRRSEIEINPKGSKLESLDVSEVSLQPTAPSTRFMIDDIDESWSGKNVEVYGRIVAVSQTNPIYPACPNCRKKVNEKDGLFTCDVCGNIDEPEYRMLFKITIDDGSGSIRATLFGESGEKLLGMTAKEAHKMIMETGNPSKPIERKSGEILGRDVIVQGRVNQFKDSVDIAANSVEYANVIDEIQHRKDELTKMMN